MAKQMKATKNSKDYWKDRQLAREQKSFDKGTKAYREYVKILRESKKEVENKIAQLYAKYQNEVGKHGIDKIQANKLLQGNDYKQWRYDIVRYVKEIEKLKATNPIEFRKLSIELETLAYKSRISRVESLKAGIDYELIKATDKINNNFTGTLYDIYSDTYKSLIDDLKYKKGVISSDTIKMALEQEWSGANYSSRIWSNTDKLATAIKNEVIIGLNKGINYRTMSQRIAEKFNTSYKNAERLVRTETNHIQNQATLMGYRDAGVIKYEFLAVLDNRTSHTCADLSGEVFDTDKAMEGENYPPMHPNCRSTTVPYEYADIFDEKNELNNGGGNGIIDETDFGKEFVAKMKNELGFKNVDYKGVDSNILNEIYNSLKEAYKEYPILQNFITDFGINADRPSTAHAWYGFGKDGQMIRGVVINPEHLKDIEKFKKTIAHAEKINWTTHKDGVGGIIRHELGHMIEYALNLKNEVLDFENATKFSKGMKEALDSIKKGTLSENIVSLAFKSERLEYNEENLIKFISKYGSTNSKEALAECIGCDTSKKIPNIVKKHIKELMKW